MKPALAVLFIALILPASSCAADDAGALLGKALDELVRNGYLGDTSAAERYLHAVLADKPDHLEARWQLLLLEIVPMKNVPLSERAEALSDLSPEFARLARLAKQSNQVAFLHYMTAMHAGLYSDYERALPEIDAAVALDPRSARYLTTKGRLLVERGRWTGSDATIEQGIAILNRARGLLRARPGPFLRDEQFEFYLAGASSELSRPRWQDVAEHYERFIEKSQDSVVRAYALNNASIAYTKLGECDKAKDAAEKALAVMKFGAAEFNKRYAEFCLEMQKSGLIVAP